MLFDVRAMQVQVHDAHRSKSVVVPFPLRSCVTHLRNLSPFQVALRGGGGDGGGGGGGRSRSGTSSSGSGSRRSGGRS